MGYSRPAYGLPPPPFVTPASRLGFGREVAALSGIGAGTSVAWFTANTVQYIPFRIERPDTALKMFVEVGATSSGNLDIGIYNSVGSRLVSSGSTAMGTANTMQVFDITDLYLPTDRYYMALSCDNTTGTIIVGSTALAGFRSVGSFIQATAFPLPSTATFASATSSTQARIPYMGISFRSLVG